MPRERLLSNTTIFIHGDHRKTIERWTPAERSELIELLLFPPLDESDIPNSRAGDLFLYIDEQNKRLLEYSDEQSAKRKQQEPLKSFEESNDNKRLQTDSFDTVSENKRQPLTLPNLTLPNQTLPNQTLPNQPLPDRTLPDRTEPTRAREAATVAVPSLSVAPSVSQSDNPSADDNMSLDTQSTQPLAEAIDVFENNFNLCNSAQREMFLNAYQSGLDPPLIALAVNIAVEKRKTDKKTGWKYIGGILNNWANDGIRTVADYERREAVFSQYSQRSEQSDPFRDYARRATENAQRHAETNPP